MSVVRVWWLLPVLLASCSGKKEPYSPEQQLDAYCQLLYDWDDAVQSAVSGPPLTALDQARIAQVTGAPAAPPPTLDAYPPAIEQWSRLQKRLTDLGAPSGLEGAHTSLQHATDSALDVLRGMNDTLRRAQAQEISPDAAAAQLADIQRRSRWASLYTESLNAVCAKLDTLTDHQRTQVCWECYKPIGAALLKIRQGGCAKAAKSAAPGTSPEPKSAPPQGSASNAVASPPTVTTPIELLHSIDGVTMTVSSTVANPAHVPSHLVDGNLGTAWNSRTGELVGANFDVALPVAVLLTELKLTAGFTSSGPKGEDWFTMNHRVRRIRVHADGKVVGEFDLDTNRRDLQTFPLNVTAKMLRVAIADVVPGSKPNWRETCISEFELWGRAASTGKTTPRVSVATPASGASCPSKDKLPKLVTSTSKVARRGKLSVHGCHAGKFGNGSWYVTAAVEVPARKGEFYGQYFLIRSVFSASGTLVALKEDENDAMHPWYWESVVAQDQNGDGVDEVIEELSGGGGVRRRNRDVYKIDGDKIERTSSKNVGGYEPDGTFVPAE